MDEENDVPGPITQGSTVSKITELFRYDNHTALARALGSCEIHCVSMCCGMNAYEVSREQFQLWADKIDQATLDEARLQVAELLAESSSVPDGFESGLLGGHQDETREWFEEIAASLAACRAGQPNSPI